MYKKTSRLRCGWGALVIAGLLTANTYGISLEFKPVDQTVPLGAPADFQLVISGLGDGVAPSLGTFDITVSFDASILGINGVMFGDPLQGDQLDIEGLGALFSYDDSLAGEVNQFEISIDSPETLADFQVDSFTLATVNFSTLALGKTSLDFTYVLLGDENGDELTPSYLGSGSITVTSGTSTVPDAGASAALLMLGLSGASLASGLVRRSQM